MPELLSSTEFHYALRKSDIDWIEVPPYGLNRVGSWESMVKLFKSALYRTLQNTLHLPSLIELQAVVSDAVRIVNDCPLTTINDQPYDLPSITPSQFLGQSLIPITPVKSFYNKRDIGKKLFEMPLCQIGFGWRE